MNKNYPILFFSTADWDSPYKTNKHYVAEELSKKGFKVIFFESFGIRKPGILSKKDVKRSFFRVLRLNKKKKINKNLFVVSILTIPFWKFEIIKKFNFKIIKKVLKNLKLNFKNYNVWSYHPFIPDEIIINSKKTIYHSVDELSLVKGIDKNNFDKQEKKFVNNTDYIFVTSRKLLTKYSKYRTYFLPNVINKKIIDIKKNKKIFKNINKPIVGFFGNLTETKIDYKLIDYTIKNLKNILFVFIGDENENENNKNLEKLKQYKNALFIKRKNHFETIKIAKNFKIGLIPFLVNNYTNNIFPMKYYEYIACGIRTISTDLDFTKKINRKYIKVSKSRIDFVKNIKHQISNKNIHQREIKLFLKNFTYENRTKKMLKLCNIP